MSMHLSFLKNALLKHFYDFSTLGNKLKCKSYFLYLIFFGETNKTMFILHLEFFGTLFVILVKSLKPLIEKNLFCSVFGQLLLIEAEF